MWPGRPQRWQWRFANFIPHHQPIGPQWRNQCQCPLAILPPYSEGRSGLRDKSSHTYPEVCAPLCCTWDGHAGTCACTPPVCTVQHNGHAHTSCVHHHLRLSQNLPGILQTLMVLQSIPRPTTVQHAWQHLLQKDPFVLLRHLCRGDLGDLRHQHPPCNSDDGQRPNYSPRCLRPDWHS